MKAIWIAFLLAMFGMTVKARCIKPDEVEMCSTAPLKGCYCKRCISCPEGYGPSHQCGGRYWNGTNITCKRCINGVSYSEENSISSCQPCHQCGGRQTLNRCTPKSETSCSTKCRVGYIMNHVVEECILDPSFKTTSKQINTVKPTTQVPETTIIHKTTQSPKTKTIHHSSTSPNQANHSRDNKIIILTVFGMAIVVAAVYFLKKKQVACFSQNIRRNQDEEGIALTNKYSTSPKPSPELVPWPEHFRLKEIKALLSSAIANLISGSSTVVKGWHAIGEELGLDPEISLRAIDVEGQKQGTNQGEELLKMLASCQPELKLTKFVNTLENLGRKDVVEFIMTNFRQKLNSVAHRETSN